MKLHEAIRRARVARGLSKAELSRLTGVCHQVIFYVEQTGGCTHTSNVEALCQALGIWFHPDDRRWDFDPIAAHEAKLARAAAAQEAKRATARRCDLCAKDHHSHGLCRRHGQLLRRHGNPHLVAKRKGPAGSYILVDERTGLPAEGVRS